MTVILSLLVMQGIMSPAFAQNQLNDHHRNKEEFFLMYGNGQIQRNRKNSLI